MNWSNPAIMLAFVAWGSVFVLSWLIVLDRVPFDGVSAGAWVFFFLVAVVSSAMISPRKEK